MKDVGIGVDNTARLEPMSYPFWLRLVPTSIFWAAGMQTTGDISIPTIKKIKLLIIHRAKLVRTVVYPTKMRFEIDR